MINRLILAPLLALALLLPAATAQAANATTSRLLDGLDLCLNTIKTGAADAFDAAAYLQGYRQVEGGGWVLDIDGGKMAITYSNRTIDGGIILKVCMVTTTRTQPEIAALKAALAARAKPLNLGVMAPETQPNGSVRYGYRDLAASGILSLTIDETPAFEDYDPSVSLAVLSR